MPDHLILCVHGIGNQRPGETVDDVLSGALAEHDRQGRDPIIGDETIISMFEEPYASFEGQSREERETIACPQTGEKTVTATVHDDNGGALKREGTATKFPMHLKRVRRQGSPEVEAVLGEVYWADLSKQPHGAFATILDLIKVVLSIGYLALDNAENVGAKAGYWLVTLYLRVLLFGVVALNTMLFLGVVVLLPEGLVAEYWGTLTQTGGFLHPLRGLEAELVIALTCLLTVGLGNYVRLTRNYLSLWRVFGKGCMFWGLLLPLGYGIYLALNGPESEDKQLGAFIGLIMFMTAVFWGLSIVTSLATYGAWLFDRGALNDSAPPQQRRFYAPVCSGLLLLWMVIASSFWLAVENSVKQIQAKDVPIEISLPVSNRMAEGSVDPSPHLQRLVEDLKPAIHAHRAEGILTTVLESELPKIYPSMGIATLGLLVLVLYAAILVLVLRGKKSKPVLHHWTNCHGLRGRLLLNRGFQWIFFCVHILSFVAIPFLALKYFDLSNFDDQIAGVAEGAPKAKISSAAKGVGLMEILDNLLPFVPPFLLAMTLLAYNFRDKVAGGLGAVRDIVVYANNNHFSFGLNSGPDNFPERVKIERRFETVADFLIAQVKPKRLTVISHSQGTVVATRNLRRMLAKGQLEGMEVTLVTMGSPVTHLYRKYFPRDFKIEPELFQGISWFNIGRTDDFVGTYIEGLDRINGEDNRPLEQSRFNLMVPAGGHPGYFTDAYVWQHFTGSIGFNLLADKPPAPEGADNAAQ